jgi:hypothetical protein
LKFNSDTNVLLKLLLTGNGNEYLGAADSVREVCRDLMNHQDAFLDAMSSAFLDFSGRFDPDELEEEFDHNAGKSLFGFMSGKKYWQLYRDLYPIITENCGGRFPQMFSEEFIREYERLIADYQRHDNQATGIDRCQDADDQMIDRGLLATRKLEKPGSSSDSASSDGFIVDVLSESAANEINQSVIDELEETLAEKIQIDQAKA